MSQKETVPGSQAINRALDILEQFTEGTPTRTISQVATATGLTSSTAHRLIKALESRGMLALDNVSKEYRLGPAVARMASPIFNQNGMTSAVAPALRYLQHETGEAVSFQVRVGYSRLCILEYESRHQLQYKSGVGQSFPLVAGSAGKAMLAFLPDSEIRQLIAEARESGRWLLRERREEDFMAEVATIRGQGFATSAGEVRADGAGVAAAILDLAGLPLGAINIGAPATRFKKRVSEDIGQLTLAAVLEVERSLGFPDRGERPASGWMAVNYRPSSRPRRRKEAIDD